MGAAFEGDDRDFAKTTKNQLAGVTAYSHARKTRKFAIGDFAGRLEVREGMLKAAAEDHGKDGPHGNLLADEGGG
jgi:hypothetical protein